MPNLKLGKRPPRIDNRIPRMSIATQGRLPPPPDRSNWYAAVGEWKMLRNDALGCCVPAAIMHSILQMSTYARTKTLIPTDAEVEELYKVTGWIPGDVSTDQGSYVLGPQGLVPHWHTNGVTCGGVQNRVDGFLQIIRKDPVEWRQGIHLFGGMMTGLMLPTAIMAADSVPYVWRDYSEPYAGGHEIWIDGYACYEGEWLYDLVSWGGRYRASEAFLMHVVDEAVVVVNHVEMNERGVNAAGLSFDQLKTDMASRFA